MISLKETRSEQKMYRKVGIPDFTEIVVDQISGSGGGASGRAAAFCPSELGSNPQDRIDFLGTAINLVSL